MEEYHVPSVATLGRLIRRNNLFFRPDSIKLRRKRSRGAKAFHRIRKPTGLKASGPGRLVEFDMKHVYLLGSRLYAFCAIDVFTRVLFDGTLQIIWKDGKLLVKELTNTQDQKIQKVA